jgi:hypothetical protein
MALSAAILLGLINIAVVVALLLVTGAIAESTLDWLGFRVPETVRKLYLALVALIALYMIVAPIFDMPMPLRIINGRRL